MIDLQFKDLKYLLIYCVDECQKVLGYQLKHSYQSKNKIKNNNEKQDKKREIK